MPTESTTYRRSLEDRLLRRATPRVVREFTPPLRELATGLWVLDRQLRHLGFARLPSRTTIVRLGDSDLAVIAPPSLHDSRVSDEIDAVGSVRYVVVPNSFHYMFAAEFARHYPSARVIVSPAMKERVSELGFADELGADAPGDWSGELDSIILGPVRGLSEILLFHRKSQTLILTDLAFNMVRYPGTLDRIVWRLSGLPGRFGPGRTTRSLLLQDRNVARLAISRAAEWPFRRIVVAHGEVISENAAEEFRTAFADYLGDQ